MAVDFASQIGGIVGSVLSMTIKVLAGILVLGIVGVGLWWRKQKNQYNIPVTIMIPRSNNNIMDEISGKGGFFKVKQPGGGEITTFRLKRKGQKSIDIPPPASRFLVGLSRHLYLIQKGIDDFEPIDPNSWRYVTTDAGNKVAVIDLKCINQDATAWVEDNRASAQRRFTLHNFWEKYKDFIQITIFIFIVMLSLYINWIGLKEVVAGLKEVAGTLSKTASAGSVTVG